MPAPPRIRWHALFSEATHLRRSGDFLFFLRRLARRQPSLARLLRETESERMGYLARVLVDLGQSPTEARESAEALGSLPIPGCTEVSVSERVSAEDRGRTRPGPELPPSLRRLGVRPIYVFERDALYEISNSTIHALLHLGWTAGIAELAVYVKVRSWVSRLYLLAISPFRHAIVYPSLIRGVSRKWRAARATGFTGPGRQVEHP